LFEILASPNRECRPCSQTTISSKKRNDRNTHYLCHISSLPLLNHRSVRRWVRTRLLGLEWLWDLPLCESHLGFNNLHLCGGRNILYCREFIDQ
jgi:hypothetical protein